MTGYMSQGYDPFYVTLYPPANNRTNSGMIMVEWYGGPTYPCGPSEKNLDFWERDPEEIIEEAIRVYCRRLDHPDPGVIARAYEDARYVGVEFNE